MRTPAIPLRTRYAPTPSGFLHPGNAFSFLLTWLIARRSGGTILLRIDDLDKQRKRPKYVADVFESLDWLGIDYDEGPSGPADFEANFSQHNRLDKYAASLYQLREAGGVFACECTRSSIDRESPDGLHPADCKQRATDFNKTKIAWRFNTEELPAEQWEDADGGQRSVKLHAAMRDFVVRKKDEAPAYQLASLADDIEFNINFIVRGNDLLESTAAQRAIARQLGKHQFLDTCFLHHELLRKEDGTKLSKSDGASSLRAIRQAGHAKELYTRLASKLGLPKSVTNAREALDAWNEFQHG